MSPPIKGHKRLAEVDEIELANPPASSPHTPKSPKRHRALTSSINGLPVEKQERSPYKSPSKALSHLSEPTEPSKAKRNLAFAFETASLDNKVQESHVDTPKEFFKEKITFPSPVFIPPSKASKPVPPKVNLSYLLARREESARAFLRLDVEAWYKQANEQTNYPEAFRCWKLAAAAAYHTPRRQKEILESLAIKQLELEKYNDALLTCDEIDLLFPQDFTPVLLLRAICHLQQKSYETCYQLFIEALEKGESFSKEEEKITPSDWENHWQLIENALVALQTAKAEVAGNLDLTIGILDLIYDLHVALSKFDEAIDALEEKEELLPGTTLLDQAFCYHYLDMPEESLVQFRSALQRQQEILNPPFEQLISAAKTLKSMSSDNTDILDLALAYCDWILVLPRSANEMEETLMMKYECLFLLKQYQEALSILQYLQPLKPNNPTYLLFQGLCYFKLDEPEKGIKLFKHALQIKESSKTVDRQALLACTTELNLVGQHRLADQYFRWASDSK